MASTTFPDGTPRAVNDDEYEVLGSVWAGDGIVGSTADTTAVFGDSTGRQVKFRAGKYAHLHGKGWYSGTTDIVKAVAANASGQPRIDLAVLRITRSTWLITEDIKTGTPAASPVAPTATRDATGGGTGVWEMPIATIAVANGAATISAVDVTVVAPNIGYPERMTFPSIAALNAFPSPPSGMYATVTTAGTDVLEYAYINGGWRRADWNDSWGVIGGQNYPGAGNLAIGVISEGYVNMSSGAVTTVVGRRYRINWGCVVQVGVAGASAVVTVRDGITTGSTAIALPVACPIPLVSGSWLAHGAAVYEPVSTAAHTFGLTGLCTPSGAGNWLRGTQAYVEVVDIGPAGKVIAQ